VVRHTRIVLATVAVMVGLLSGALAPAAGDERVTGSSAAKVSYTEDGIPFVDTGPQCKAGSAAHKLKRHADKADASDY
jgi:hypothetical protein